MHQIGHTSICSLLWLGYRSSMAYLLPAYHYYRRTSSSTKVPARTSGHGCQVFIKPGLRTLPYCSRISQKGCVCLPYQRISEVTKLTGDYAADQMGDFLNDTNDPLTDIRADELFGTRPISFYRLLSGISEIKSAAASWTLP